MGDFNVVQIIFLFSLLPVISVSWPRNQKHQAGVVSLLMIPVRAWGISLSLLAVSVSEDKVQRHLYGPYSNPTVFFFFAGCIKLAAIVLWAVVLKSSGVTEETGPPLERQGRSSSHSLLPSGLGTHTWSRCSAADFRAQLLPASHRLHALQHLEGREVTLKKPSKNLTYEFRTFLGKKKIKGLKISSCLL